MRDLNRLKAGKMFGGVAALKNCFSIFLGNRIRNRKNRRKEFRDHCLENLNNCEFVHTLRCPINEWAQLVVAMFSS